MTFAHSKNSRVMVNEKHLSGYINGWTVTHNRALGEVTTVLDEGGKYIPGLMSGAVALRGLFDSAEGAIHEEISAAVGVDNSLLVTVFPDAITVGKPAFIAVSDLENYTVDASVSEAVGVAVDAMPDDGVDWGVCLHAHSAETADGNGTSVDEGASTSNGGVASLHVTAFADLTSAVVKVQHSSDDSVWADLVTFTTATDVTSERKTVTGTVNQYVRATVDVTGTGSITYTVAFARR